MNERIFYLDDSTVRKVTGNDEEIRFLQALKSCPRIDAGLANVRGIEIRDGTASYSRDRVVVSGMEGSLRYLSRHRKRIGAVSKENLSYNANMLYAYIHRLNGTCHAIEKERASLPSADFEEGFRKGLTYEVPESPDLSARDATGKRELVRLLVAAWGKLAKLMEARHELSLEGVEKQLESWDFWLGRRTGSALRLLFEQGFIPELAEGNFAIVEDFSEPVLAYLGPGTFVERRNPDKPEPDRIGL